MEELAVQIILLAIEDYKLLQEYKTDSLLIECGNVLKKKELEKFFGSAWCNFLLHGIGSEMTGNDLLRLLNK